MGHYFGKVRVGGALFWEGGGRWGIVLGGWGDGWGRVRVVALFDNAQKNTI